MSPTPVDPISECVRLSQEVELYKMLWKQRDGELMETLNDAVKIEDERNQLRRENLDLSASVSELRSEEVIARMQLDQLREDVTLLMSELTNYKLGFAKRTEELENTEAFLEKSQDEVARLTEDRDGWKKADVLARLRISELERERDEARAMADAWRERADRRAEDQKEYDHLLPKVQEENAALRTVLKRALPVLDEHASDETAFWGGPEHDIAKDAVEIFEQARAALGKEESK